MFIDAGSAVAPGQGSGKEQGEFSEDGLLQHRECGTVSGEQCSTLDASRLALQRGRGKRPPLHPAPPAGLTGSTASLAGRQRCPAWAGAGHGLRVWGRTCGCPLRLPHLHGWGGLLCCSMCLGRSCQERRWCEWPAAQSPRPGLLQGVTRFQVNWGRSHSPLSSSNRALVVLL